LYLNLKNMSDIKLIKLTNDNIPNVEVIAINYQNECIVGYINFDNDEFTCENNHEMLEKVTHFMYIPKI